MKTKAVFFQLHKKREDFFLLILNSHINKRIEGGFRDGAKLHSARIRVRSPSRIRVESAGRNRKDRYF